MDHRDNNIAWIVAGVLFVLLIIVGYLWLAARNDLMSTLSSAHESISAERDQIAKDCQGTDQTSKDACSQDLQDLADTLRAFSANVATASSTGQFPTTTTEAQ